jgi:deoxycytidine triphosphate deaminase
MSTTAGANRAEILVTLHDDARMPDAVLAELRPRSPTCRTQ